MLYCFLYSHSAFIAWFGYSHFDLWLPLLNFRTLTEFLLNMFLVHYYESKQLSELWSFMTRFWCWPWVYTMNVFDVQCYWLALRSPHNVRKFSTELYSASLGLSAFFVLEKLINQDCDFFFFVCSNDIFYIILDSSYIFLFLFLSH